MPSSEAKKRADNKYFREHYTNLACKVRKEFAEDVKSVCRDSDITVNALLAEFCRMVIGQPTNDRMVRKFIIKTIKKCEENT